MKKLLLAALCAAGFAPLYADNAVKETGVIEAGVIDSRGLFVRDFGVPGTSEDGVMLIQCGADVLPDFQDIEPGVAVICSPFREAELSPAQPKPADCELSWEAAFVLPFKGKAEIRWTCRGDTDFGTPNTAFAVGDKVSGSGWQCERGEESVTCKNGDGHGFVISRAEQKTF